MGQIGEGDKEQKSTEKHGSTVSQYKCQTVHLCVHVLMFMIEFWCVCV